ncbi:MAG: DUF2231 domain-containing protein [Candidatus Kryptoniota bacterium]
MQNIHPLFVHFPIVLALIAALFELLSLLLKKETLFNMTSGLVVLTAIAAIATAITGLIAGGSVPHPDEAHPLMDTHKILELIGGSLSIVTTLWVIFLKKRARIVRTILILLTAVIISYGGFYGGRLVYEYGIGTQLVKSGMVDEPGNHNNIEMQHDSSKETSGNHSH